MLNKRQLQILEMIVDDFIDSGQPVGSRTIAKKLAIGISSATIRNEMADLEELGYLYQPHTSAGRIPSDLGYRLYVDSFSDKNIISTKQKMMIRNLLLSGKIKSEEVITNAVNLMVELTGMAVIASFPGFKKRALMNLKLIKISNSKVLLILISDNEVIKNITLPFSSTNQTVLDLISDSLMKNLRGSTIEDINIKKISRLKIDLKEYGDVIDYLVPILRDTLEDIEYVDYCVQGLENILSIPKFEKIEKVKKLFEAFDNKKLINELFEDITDEGIFIMIGEENKIEEFKECSIIATTYKYRDEDLGKFAVIGPKRMNYGHVVSVVNYIKKTLSDIFEGINL